MIRILLLSTLLVAGPSSLALAGSTLQMGRSATMDQQAPRVRRSRVTAAGRCNGISYGTGQRACGTATGGTSGGNPSRN